MTNRRATFILACTLLPAACTSRTLESPAINPAASVSNIQTYHQNNKLDLLFMIDNSLSMKTMQQKLEEQLPGFMQVLKDNASGLPDVHIAVVSSDMGAPSDTQISTCGATGDQGKFQYKAQGACTGTTLADGATFLSDSNGIANFTGQITDVFQCIALLGDLGCGFEHQLASIDRALGADGQGPPPAQNAGFLRDDAILAIVLLTNEDDCSAPPNTTLYSENGGKENLSNPLGPLGGGFRCNRYGHLCKDPVTGQTGMPPLTPPADATGNPPMLALQDCTSNDTDSGLLTPVSKFINDIRGLKTDPDNQILVSAIAAPAAPYGVVWRTDNNTANEAWPEIMHSCGVGPGVTNPAAETTTDGSFGDPAVRIQQFLGGFQDSVFASVCEPSYAGALAAIANRINQKFAPPCVTAKIAKTASGTPACNVSDRIFNGTNNNWGDQELQNCDENGNQPPCWRLQSGGTTCAGQVLVVNESSANQAATTIQRTMECVLCLPGTSQPGCD
ncbi:MAG TPA: hypothetical protein VN962_16265 [Polyangia bacterium]|nr:hypothetical protein [Polyangia bacterium]